MYFARANVNRPSYGTLWTSGSRPPSPPKNRCAESATLTPTTASAAAAISRACREMSEPPDLRSTNNMPAWMRRLLVPALWILLSWCGSGEAHAQTFTFEAMGGSAYNVPTPLTVSQTGYPEIRFSAHYDTKPFGPFYPYYSWRASSWNQEHDQAWEITQVHHRLFLANDPPEIQFFAIHFG